MQPTPPSPSPSDTEVIVQWLDRAGIIQIVVAIILSSFVGAWLYRRLDDLWGMAFKDDETDLRDWDRLEQEIRANEYRRRYIELLERVNENLLERIEDEQI